MKGNNFCTGGIFLKLMDLLTISDIVRQKRVLAVTISNFKVDVSEDSINCNCVSNRQYMTEIKLLNIVNPQAICFCDCTCKSFMFEYANTIHKNNGLIYPDRYPDLAAKNKHNFGCKHIIKFAQYIYHRSTLIKREVNKK